MSGMHSVSLKVFLCSRFSWLSFLKFMWNVMYLKARFWVLSYFRCHIRYKLRYFGVFVLFFFLFFLAEPLKENHAIISLCCHHSLQSVRHYTIMLASLHWLPSVNFWIVWKIVRIIWRHRCWIYHWCYKLLSMFRPMTRGYQVITISEQFALAWCILGRTDQHSLA